VELLKGHSLPHGLWLRLMAGLQFSSRLYVSRYVYYDHKTKHCIPNWKSTNLRPSRFVKTLYPCASNRLATPKPISPIDKTATFARGSVDIV